MPQPTASLVYDGHRLLIPESMGQPSSKQLRGTVLENLGELASRICYDSLGNGRSSAALHQHILEVKNLSVYEHCNFTVTVKDDSDILTQFTTACVNRKGVWVERVNSEILEITANFRAVLEWERHFNSANRWGSQGHFLHAILHHHALVLAPEIFGHSVVPSVRHTSTFLNSSRKSQHFTADQAHISLYLFGSRGMSHEQVRHRFAMSQRSTRYVDESESPYIIHPLIEQSSLRDQTLKSMAEDKATYNNLVSLLQQYCMDRGMEGTAARKQARGAARGFLGNALATELIFTASANNWLWMLKQRCSVLADAEIRLMYNAVLPALQSSAFGSFFTHLRLVPSPDGIGQVLGGLDGNR